MPGSLSPSGLTCSRKGAFCKTQPFQGPGTSRPEWPLIFLSTAPQRPHSPPLHALPVPPPSSAVDAVGRHQEVVSHRVTYFRGATPAFPGVSMKCVLGGNLAQRCQISADCLVVIQAHPTVGFRVLPDRVLIPHGLRGAHASLGASRFLPPPRGIGERSLCLKWLRSRGEGPSLAQAVRGLPVGAALEQRGPHNWRREQSQPAPPEVGSGPLHRLCSD